VRFKTELELVEDNLRARQAVFRARADHIYSGRILADELDYHIEFIRSISSGSAPSPATSLRDKFATAAMQGMVSGWLASNAQSRVDHATIAASAYGMADAMIEARDK
jgi:hypothetical protein